MSRLHVLVLIGILLVTTDNARADIVLDWNATAQQVMQNDGVHLNNSANPGWATRTLAMMNGAIYDAFQSINRTHAPFLFRSKTTNASLEAAVHQAARDLLLECYSHSTEQLKIQEAYNSRMALIAESPEKANGILLGTAIAQMYKNSRLNDGSDSLAPWPEGTLPGEWRSDPLHAPQVAWGPQWGAVRPFVINHSSQFPVPGPPALDSLEYKQAYDMVLDYGALSTFGPSNTPTSRTADQTEIGLFWAYDRATMGPPPVLFIRNLGDIASAVGNSPAENARLFALASTAMADAAITAWDVKFADNFWRPITGIREVDNDNNIQTVGDPNWVPLGAPGAIAHDPNNPSAEDDFTPPFPAYVSGHATMGGALFKAIELFYGTNSFQSADASVGNDVVDSQYFLYSDEFNANGIAGMARSFDKFTQEGIIDIGLENSPEGENATSRIYLGVHWIFDQRDGNYLGNEIAEYVFANRFQAVPEPGAGLLMLTAVVTRAIFDRPLRRRCHMRLV